MGPLVKVKDIITKGERKGMKKENSAFFWRHTKYPVEASIWKM